MTEDTLGFFMLLIVFFLAAVGYFLPSFVAKARRHKNTMAIFMLNLFLGYSFVGWVVALVWAFKEE